MGRANGGRAPETGARSGFKRKACPRRGRRTSVAVGAMPASDAQVRTPLPAALGPYRVIDVLGRGGMGVVYRGVHAATGAPAAIKTIHSANATVLAGIRREIHALGQLQHPGIVRVIGEGISDGVPWYAMDLLVGRTLRDLLDTGSAPKTSGVVGTSKGHLPPGLTNAPVREASEPSPTLSGGGARRSPYHSHPRADPLRLVRNLCEALSHLHACGIVHRDLKPENVFVRSDGSPVLVDFGLVGRFGGESGREQLDVAGASAIGTSGYMAPEQIRGELVDARTDLYALGCILYECVTGQRPFVGDHFYVLDAHLSKRPVPPADLADGINPQLDRLILQLLEKEPSDRLGYAEDVARALAPSVDQAEAAASPSHTRPYLYRPPFLGRESALGALQDAVRELTEQERGGTIYIGGESGVGKTRLAIEAARHAARSGVAVILSQCGSLGVGPTEESGDAPLHAFAPVMLAVADYCRAQGLRESARVLGRWGGILAPYQPALRDVPGCDASPVAVEPKDARARVFSALADVLFAFAKTRTLLLVIDDVQWADELSMGFLRTLSEQGLAGRPILVVATYRADQARSELLETVTARGAHHLQLERLGFEHVQAIAAGMLALKQIPAELVEFLQSRCDGNAFFVVEYLRSAIEAGLIVREGGRWDLVPQSRARASYEQKVTAPPGIVELLEQRLRGLGVEGRRLVETAAVLGREFDPDLLFACASLSQPAAMAPLDDLRRRYIVEDTEGGGLRFVHDKIRQTVYDGIRDERRALLHRSAAVSIEERGAEAPETWRALGLHSARAKLHGKAALYFGKAGDFAASAHANADALACYRAAMDELELARETESPSAASSLQEKVGDVQSITGNQEAARLAYHDALARHASDDAPGLARLYRKIGKTCEIHHDHSEALTNYARAAETLDGAATERGEPWWRERVQVHLDRIWVNYWLNRVEGMASLIEEARPALVKHGTAFQRARFHQLVAMMNIRKERYLVSDETVRLAREAVAAGASLSEAESAALRFGLFFSLVLRGSLEEAEGEGLAVLAWAQRSGAATLRARCLTYLSIVARQRRQIDLVKARVSQCLSACAQARMGEYVGACHANSAWIAWQDGRLDDVERWGSAALAAWRSERNPYPLQWLAHFPLLATSLTRNVREDTVVHARALLDIEQQRLKEPMPAELESILEESDAPERGHPRIILLAQQLHYL